MKPLNEALLQLDSPQDISDFLKDLCTPPELREMEQRWCIAQLLDQQNLSYREIAEQTGASVTTVTRVARFLKDEPWQGYRRALNRIKGLD